MTGLDLAQFTARSIPEDILPPPIPKICRGFLDAVPREGTEKSLSALDEQIEIVWTRTRPSRMAASTGPRLPRRPGLPTKPT
jgi:hypothetical protein